MLQALGLKGVAVDNIELECSGSNTFCHCCCMQRSEFGAKKFTFLSSCLLSTIPYAEKKTQKTSKIGGGVACVISA